MIIEISKWFRDQPTYLTKVFYVIYYGQTQLIVNTKEWNRIIKKAIVESVMYLAIE